MRRYCFNPLHPRVLSVLQDPVPHLHIPHYIEIGCGIKDCPDRDEFECSFSSASSSPSSRLVWTCVDCRDIRKTSQKPRVLLPRIVGPNIAAEVIYPLEGDPIRERR